MLGMSLSAAQAQNPQPPQMLDEKGFVEAVSGNTVTAKLERTLPWQIAVIPGETNVTVTGTAEPSYLQSGLSIKFSGELDKKGTALPKEIEQIEVLAAGGKPGVFDSANPDKPVRAPVDGTTYEIRTKVVSFKPDANELTVTIGGKRIVAKTSASLAITVNSTDVSLAQEGDAVAVKGLVQQKPNPQNQQPGYATAQSLAVTLTKPLAGAVKKGKRPVAKAARGAKTPAAPAEPEVRNPFSTK
jgi:hypothetical protein